VPIKSEDTEVLSDARLRWYKQECYEDTDKTGWAELSRPVTLTTACAVTDPWLLLAVQTYVPLSLRLRLFSSNSVPLPTGLVMSLATTSVNFLASQCSAHNPQDKILNVHNTSPSSVKTCLCLHQRGRLKWKMHNRDHKMPVLSQYYISANLYTGAELKVKHWLCVKHSAVTGFRNMN